MNLGILPSILSADCVTVLRMLWEGDVDPNQRRAILQHHTASNHSYPAAKAKMASGERKTEINKGREKWQVYNDRFPLFEERSILCRSSQTTLYAKKKQLHLFYSVLSLAQGNLPKIARI